MPHFSYDLVEKCNGPKISIDSKLFSNGKNTQLLTPGPGNYDPTALLSKSSVGVTMGAKYDFSYSKSNYQPGPGTYNV
jgi:hypothetical protein